MKVPMNSLNNFKLFWTHFSDYFFTLPIFFPRLFCTNLSENLFNTIVTSFKTLENLYRVEISVSKDTRSIDLTGKVTVYNGAIFLLLQQQNHLSRCRRNSANNPTILATDILLPCFQWQQYSSICHRNNSSYCSVILATTLHIIWLSQWWLISFLFSTIIYLIPLPLDGLIHSMGEKIWWFLSHYVVMGFLWVCIV